MQQHSNCFHLTEYTQWAVSEGQHIRRRLRAAPNAPSTFLQLIGMHAQAVQALHNWSGIHVCCTDRASCSWDQILSSCLTVCAGVPAGGKHTSTLHM